MSQNQNDEEDLQSYAVDHQIDENEPIINQENFISAELKLENWQYLNDFDDSEIIPESPPNYIYVQNNKLLIQDTKKASSQMKKIEGRGGIKYQQQEHSLSYEINYKQTNFPNLQKSKKIKKTNSKKLKDCQQYDKKMNSLKHISSSVCDYVHLVSCVSYPDLFQKFVGDGNQSKNLKRRMYDVINVLSSVSVLKKKGQILAKIPHQKSSNLTENILDNEYLIKNQTMQDVKQLQQQIKQKQKIIQQKKQILKELKQKKKNLCKLNKRNQVSKNAVREEHKIHFPFLCFIPEKQTKCEITPNQAKLIFTNNEEQQTEVLTQSDAISYINLKLRKKVPSKIDTEISYELVKGVSTMCLGQQTNKP